MKEAGKWPKEDTRPCGGGGVELLLLEATAVAKVLMIKRNVGTLEITTLDGNF